MAAIADKSGNRADKSLILIAPTDTERVLSRKAVWFRWR